MNAVKHISCAIGQLEVSLSCQQLPFVLLLRIRVNFWTGKNNKTEQNELAAPNHL